MRLRTGIIIAGIALLCVKPGAKAANAIDSKLPEMTRRFFEWTQDATEPGPPPQRLIAMQSDLDQRLSALSNIICHEQISRYSDRDKATVQLDRLDTDVEIANGVENYTAIRRDKKLYSDIFKVPGTWSVGEVVTLIRITRDALDLKSGLLEGDDNSDPGQTRLTAFKVPASAKLWYLKVYGQTLWLPFEGRIWTNPGTGDILRVAWRASDLPPESGVSEVLWTVNFKAVDLASKVVTLPEEALYRVQYTSGENRSDWNITRFSGYRRFGADTSIKFDKE